MKTARPLAVGFLVGMAMGAVVMSFYLQHRSERSPEAWLFTYYTYKIIEDVDNLTALRRGGMEDVIGNIECDLNTVVHDLARDFPGMVLSNKASIRVLKAAYRYRSEHPFTAGDAEEARVAGEVLAAAKNKGVNP